MDIIVGPLVAPEGIARLFGSNKETFPNGNTLVSVLLLCKKTAVAGYTY